MIYQTIVYCPRYDEDMEIDGECDCEYSGWMDAMEYHCQFEHLTDEEQLEVIRKDKE